MCFFLTTPIVSTEDMVKEMKTPKEPVHYYLDHFVVGISDLNKGMDLIEDKTGVRPVYGGMHPAIGTHNALISLGSHTYLEIIAPNPERDIGNLDPMLNSQFMEPLKKMTSLTPFLWAVGSSDLSMTHRLLAGSGIELSNLDAGSRKKPDGTILHWQTAFITKPRLAEFPFFIRWGDTTVSPAEDSPKGCRFERFSVSGPDMAALQKLKKQVGLEMEISTASELDLQLTLSCPKGKVTL